MKHAYTLFLKTGPACNAGCPSCPSGERREVEKIPLMKEGMFVRILDRMLEQAKVISVVLHYYNEPTLNPHMPAIIRYAVKRKVETLMSTNGSYPENLAKCMAEGLRNLIFSVSGWTQQIHERSHRYTDIELIKQNMIDTAKNLKKGQFVRVGWHDYLYNRHEQAMMREFALSLGFTFTPYQTSVLPLDLPIKRFYELEDNPFTPETPAERDVITKLTEAKQLCAERKHFTCIYQQRMVAVDGNGMLYSCAARNYAENIRESIFDTGIEDFQQRRLNDAACNVCKAVGGHVYGMQKYRTPLDFKNNVLRFAEDTYRALGIGGRFHWLTRKLNQWTYERPKKGTSNA